MIVLWIDPWTTTTWYALVEKIWWKAILLDYGIIETRPKIELKYKLLEIASDLESIINNYNPDMAVIEKLYFTNNIKTWIDVSHARWAIMLELAKRAIDIKEFTPLELKSAICGNWKANKTQLQNAIKIIFWLDSIPKPDDAADAIWLAYMW